MMKKRNVAVAMAVATVAGTIAPVISNAASDTVEKDIMVKDAAKLVSKVRELLSEEYTDEDLGKIYEVKTNLKQDNEDDTKLIESSHIINNATELGTIIGLLGKDNESGSKNSTELNVEIIDKGHAKIDDKIVDETVLKYEKASELSELVLTKNSQDGQIFETKFDADEQELNVKIGFEVENSSTGFPVGVEELINDGSLVNIEVVGDKTRATKEFTIALGDDHLKIDKNKQTFNIDAPEFNVKDVDSSKVFISDNINNGNDFEKMLKLLKNTTITKTGVEKIGRKTLANLTIKDEELENLEVSDLFDGLQLTPKAKDFITNLGVNYEEDDKIYRLEADTNESKIEKVTEKERTAYYKMPIEITKYEVANGTEGKTDGSKVDSGTKIATLTIKDENKSNIIDLLNVINKKEARFDTIAGSNRTTTAIEVSEELEKQGENYLDGNSVVLVNSQAIVDGLSATPFAAVKKAPILLTDTNAVNKETMNRIKEILVDNTPVNKLDKKTVYLIGGENVISPEVESQLKTLGVSVERIAGNNRVETSLEIAEEVMKANKGSKSTDAFVVGFNGEADAMSISSKAAELKSPIVVTGSELTKDAKKLLEGKQIDIIGGSTVVSEDVANELKSIDKDSKVKRIDGLNRRTTNANVIKEYYRTVDTVFVAKDGQGDNDKLVDALSAGTLAASKKAPVILSTEVLSNDQDEVLDLRLASDANIKQVGYGVNDSVIKTIAKKLGLVK